MAKQTTGTLKKKVLQISNYPFRKGDLILYFWHPDYPSYQGNLYWKNSYGGKGRAPEVKVGDWIKIKFEAGNAKSWTLDKRR